MQEKEVKPHKSEIDDYLMELDGMISATGVEFGGNLRVFLCVDRSDGNAKAAEGQAKEN